jgi:hypothetical protein
MGAHELLAREIVQVRGEPLGHAPRVAEDQGRVVRADQLDEARVDVRPDAGARFGRQVDGPVGGGRGVQCELGHVVDRDDDLQLQILARAGVDDRDGTRPFGRVTPEEVRDLVERALRGRQRDALRRSLRDRCEPFEADHEVRAALRRCHRVDLVDDHVLDRTQRLACARREHEVERLRGRDQDVGRRAHQRLAFLAGRVAGAHAHRRHPQRNPEPLGREGDAGQWRAQVLLDVDGERAQR